MLCCAVLRGAVGEKQQHPTATVCGPTPQAHVAAVTHSPRPGTADTARGAGHLLAPKFLFGQPTHRSRPPSIVLPPLTPFPDSPSPALTREAYLDSRSVKAAASTHTDYVGGNDCGWADAEHDGRNSATAAKCIVIPSTAPIIQPASLVHSPLDVSVHTLTASIFVFPCD